MIISQFEFSIDCDKEKSEELLALIIDFAEQNGYQVAGGFHVEEGSDGEEA